MTRLRPKAMPHAKSLWAGLVLVSGQALTAVNDAVSIAIRHRTCRNLPLYDLERSETAFRIADMSADGYSRMRGSKNPRSVEMPLRPLITTLNVRPLVGRTVRRRVYREPRTGVLHNVGRSCGLRSARRSCRSSRRRFGSPTGLPPRTLQPAILLRVSPAPRRRPAHHLRRPPSRRRPTLEHPERSRVRQMRPTRHQGFDRGRSCCRCR